MLVIAVEGASFVPSKGRAYRVDKGSNRLSYTRQMSSLVTLCKEAAVRFRPTRPCEQLIDRREGPERGGVYKAAWIKFD